MNVRDDNHIGYRMHARHTEPLHGSKEAREILASMFEKQFPVEAEMARKSLHFMLPASWAVEAIHQGFLAGARAMQEAAAQAAYAAHEDNHDAEFNMLWDYFDEAANAITKAIRALDPEKVGE